MVRVEIPRSCAATDLSPFVCRSVSRMTRSSISSSGVPISKVSCVDALGGGRGDVVGQVALAQRVAAREDDGALDHVLELAHVARPGVVHQPLERAARRVQARSAVLRAVQAEEVVDEQRDVLAPRAQRRAP